MLTKLKRNPNLLTYVVPLCGGLGALVLIEGFGVGKLSALGIVLLPGVALGFLLDKFVVTESASSEDEAALGAQRTPESGR